MSKFINFLFSYIIFFLLWFIVNILAYCVSIVFNKKNIFNILNKLSKLIFVFAGIYLFFVFFDVIINLFREKFLIFILFLIFLFSFAINLIATIVNLIIAPFLLINEYFLKKLEEFDSKGKNEKGELEDGKESIIQIHLAKFFLILYFICLLDYILFSIMQNYYWYSFIIIPFLKIISGSLIFGLIYSIYHKIKYGSFTPKNKEYFLLNVWKLFLIGFGFIYGFIIFSRLF